MSTIKRCIRSIHARIMLCILLVSMTGHINSSEVGAQDQENRLRHVIFSDNGRDYSGGRGLITNAGPTGMFLNPTSGTMPEGSITAQAFSTVIKPLPNKDQFAWYNALVSYGLRDWIEIGALAQLVDQSNNVLTSGTVDKDNQSVMGGGAFFRLRVLKDEKFWPELSVGGITVEGNEILRRRTLFIAASKRFVVSEDGVIRAIRLHLGGRQFWQREGSALSFTTWSFLAQRGSEDHVGYAGGELEFRRNIYLVGEVQTKETGNRYIPWSAGIQVRHPSGFGLSIAVLQPGFQSSLTGYIGIGINFM